MEQKNIKTNVFSLDTVFSESSEQPIDADFTLPDYCPDISKILKCRAVPRISSKNLSGNNISAEGCVNVTVIYCDENNRLNSYEYQYPFSKNFDTGVNTDGAYLNVNVKCEYINCRAVTSRKIDIHGAVGIYVTLSKRKLTEVISDVDDSDIELLRGQIPATVPMGCSEKYLSLEEEIELGQGQPDIRCIVRYDASATIHDSKILAGKTVVKGEMNLKIFYLPENGSAQTVRYTIPFSQILEIDGINDNCDCESKVYIAQLDIKPRIYATGESRSFVMCAKLLVTCECFCNNDVAVILDAYSRKFEADIQKNEVCFNKICENINEVFNYKKTVDISDGAISEISDTWCDAKTENVRFNDGVFMVKGIITAYIIAFTTDGTPCFFEKTFDFEYTHPINSEAENFKSEPEITVSAFNYTLVGENSIELRVDLNISAAVYTCTKTPLIVDISLNGELVKKERKCAMTLYFASAGENVWDIARHYFADVEEIKKINRLDDLVLNSDSVVLVPIC